MSGTRANATALVAALQLSASALAAQRPAVTELFPAEPTGYVTDVANVVDPSSASRITDLIKRGMSLEQVLAANPTADLASKFVTSGPQPDKAATDRFLTAFYNAVKSEL